VGMIFVNSAEILQGLMRIMIRLGISFLRPAKVV
jgi:hypothetical protein